MEWGSPIKGYVKRKNTSPFKKMANFFLIFTHNSATWFLLLSAPVISVLLVDVAFNRLAPVTHQDQGIVL
jgi:hypothetical protein